MKYVSFHLGVAAINSIQHGRNVGTVGRRCSHCRWRYNISLLQRALRKVKEQIEKLLVEDLKTPYHSEGIPTPSTSSNSLDIGDLKQALGAVYAEGGLTRDYSPIAEYEGRHRWDPVLNGLELKRRDSSE